MVIVTEINIKTLKIEKDSRMACQIAYKQTRDGAKGKVNIQIPVSTKYSCTLV